MWPVWVSNSGPLTYESGALPIALRGPAHKFEEIHPLVQKLCYLQDYDLKNEVMVTKILSALKLVIVLY